jgi:uncharacterized protein YbjT (DUF2867 family)
MPSQNQSSDPPGRTAVVAGATGLVGAELLRLLNAAPDYARVVALVRRALPPGYRRVEARRCDFEHLAAAMADLPGTAAPLDVFCALGTTIKVAGSQQAFRRVDFDYVLALARWAQAARARRFIVVSALGADPTSRNFYSRVKGGMEQAVRALGVPVTMLRPSLLAGERDEFRFGERIALAVTAPLRALIPAGVRPVAAVDVAASMLAAARAATPPALLESKSMQGAAARL